MIYLLIDKATSGPRVFGSLVALCDATGLKIDRFYSHFGRHKHTQFENSEIQIFKLPIERSTNKSKS
jgi:hypothetical protein